MLMAQLTDHTRVPVRPNTVLKPCKFLLPFKVIANIVFALVIVRPSTKPVRWLTIEVVDCGRTASVDSTSEVVRDGECSQHACVIFFTSEMSTIKGPLDESASVECGRELSHYAKLDQCFTTNVLQVL